MVVSTKGPKKAVSWYLKTRAGIFLSLFIFFILFMALLYVLPFIFGNFGIAAIVSVIISIILTGLFLYYYNKKFVKEWKETNKLKEPIKKTPKTIATIFIISFVIFAILSFIIEAKIISTISRIVLGILFLGYIYFKFIKK